MSDERELTPEQMADELVFPYGPPAEQNMRALARKVAEALRAAERRGAERERDGARADLEFVREAMRKNITAWAYKDEVVLYEAILKIDGLLADRLCGEGGDGE